MTIEAKCAIANFSLLKKIVLQSQCDAFVFEVVWLIDIICLQCHPCCLYETKSACVCVWFWFDTNTNIAHCVCDIGLWKVFSSTDWLSNVRVWNANLVQMFFVCVQFPSHAHQANNQSHARSRPNRAKEGGEMFEIHRIPFSFSSDLIVSLVWHFYNNPVACKLDRLPK